MQLIEICKQSISGVSLLEKYDINIQELKEEADAFISYWTEKNPNGKKERWQKEKTFDPSRRFHTWLRNNKKWNKWSQKRSTPANIIFTNEI